MLTSHRYYLYNILNIPNNLLVLPFISKNNLARGPLTREFTEVPSIII